MPPTLYDHRGQVLTGLSPEAFTELVIQNSVSGQAVNETTAMKSSAVVCAITKISGTIASMPIDLFRTTEAGREKAKDHPLYYLLHNAPNDEIHSYEWVRQIIIDLLIWSNHLSQIVRDRAGRVISINPVPWPAVRMERRGGALTYLVHEESNRERAWTKESVIHIRDVGTNPLEGLCRIKYGREEIGTSLALKDYIASFYGNSAVPALKYKVPGQASKETKEAIRADLSRAFSRKGAHSTIVLDQDQDVEPIAQDKKATEFLGLINASVDDISRLFWGIPPHLLSNLSKSSFSNITQQHREFLDLTLLPAITNIQRAISFYLLTRAEVDAGLYAEFNTAHLEKMDVQVRYDTYQKGIFSGTMLIDEARSRENLPALPDGMGKVPLVQSSMVPLSIALEGPKTPAPFAAPVEEEEAEEVDTVEGGTRSVASQADPTERVPPRAAELIRDYREFLRAVKPEERSGHKAMEYRFRTLTEADQARFVEAWVESNRGEYRSSRTRLKLRTSANGVLANSATKLATRFRKNIRQLMDKFLPGDLAGFRMALQEYFDGQGEGIRKEIAPVLRSLGLALATEASEQVGERVPQDIVRILDEYIDGAAYRIRQGKNGQLQKMIADSIEPERLADALDLRLGEWEEKDGDKFAAEQSVKLDGWMSRQVWTLLGISAVVWNTVQPCDFCDQLASVRVETTKEFLVKGGSIQDDDGETLTKTSRSTLAPPIHGGCQCYLAPG